MGQARQAPQRLGAELGGKASSSVRHGKEMIPKKMLPAVRLGVGVIPYAKPLLPGQSGVGSPLPERL